MTRGIEAAAAGMTSILLQHDIIANNMANVNTPGFKQGIATFKNFEEVLVNQIDAKKGYTQNQIGSLSSGSILDMSTVDFKQGSLKSTGNALDFAISGQGFFTVMTPQGEAYTRNGSFIRGQNGQLTTNEGYPVMGENGIISLNVNDNQLKDIKVDSNGQVQLNGQVIDNLKIVEFKNPNTVNQLGNSLYKATPGNNPVKATNYEVNQGAIESSNANMVESMVNSITGMRTYETLGKVIETSHRSLSKTVGEVGRVKR